MVSCPLDGAGVRRDRDFDPSRERGVRLAVVDVEPAGITAQVLRRSARSVGRPTPDASKPPSTASSWPVM